MFIVNYFLILVRKFIFAWFLFMSSNVLFGTEVLITIIALKTLHFHWKLFLWSDLTPRHDFYLFLLMCVFWNWVFYHNICIEIEIFHFHWLMVLHFDLMNLPLHDLFSSLLACIFKLNVLLNFLQGKLPVLLLDLSYYIWFSVWSINEIENSFILLFVVLLDFLFS